ncbi:ABC transporter transmembrane region [Ceratobasidium sp. AG-Ba]|nr:ABC transporter transmembrane region [Ceratobasidium sp. AG-Ba]
MNHQLDEGDANERYRRHWYQLWIPSSRPPPPPSSLNDATLTPLATASVHSKRRIFGVRVEKAKSNPKGKRSWFGLGKAKNPEDEGPSLAWALNDALGKDFWLGGLYKVVGDVSQLMSPLLVKAIIRFAQERGRGGPNVPHIGNGIGLAIGLPLLTICTSVCTHQFFWRSMTTGVAARAALTASLYSRGLRFRPGQDNHDLVNHVSTDVSRIDYCAQWFHAIWTAPIQVSICLILLCLQLGPAALAGFSLFAFLIPIQQGLMSYQLKMRKGSMQYTDQRASLLRELLGSMRVVKVCAYEAQFEKRLGDVRKKELVGVRGVLFIKAANQAVAFAIPTLAAVISFVTYAATHNKGLDPAIIFPSVGLFSMLRQPLMFLPRALSSAVDARNAISRLRVVFLTETIDTQIAIEPHQADAVVVKGAEFVWYNVPGAKGKGAKGKAEKKNGDPEKNTSKKEVAFRLTDVSLSVPRGSLTAIVGPVGSGKSSLLLGMLGEMPQTKGKVVFGGRTAYCAQSAWIQNATLRDNVVFGRPWDEERYWASIRDASLEVDLELLPDGDLTEIGEKGINLSGGQKQRVNIARALYDDSAEVFLLDDPLSAVDAHVGNALFHNAILNNLKARGKTVLLVTHALHFLPSVDYVYTLARNNEIRHGDEKDEKKVEALEDGGEDHVTLAGEPSSPVLEEKAGGVGRIAEQGTYGDLMRAGRSFARLVEEFGGGEARKQELEEPSVEEGVKGKDVREKMEKISTKKGAGTGKLEGKLIQAEKRTTGSVKWNIYGRYFSFGSSLLIMPIVIICILLAQGCYGLNNFWLVWWQDDAFNQSPGIYMAGYAALGVGYALFSLIMGIALCCLTYESSKHLHRQTLNQVFHAPMSFFDTTPLGRILGVFGKDIDTVDNLLSDSIRMYIFTVSMLVAGVIVITILEYYFIAVIVVILVLYQYFAAFYRASAREMKRLDASLRSLLYSHFSESLTGIATIRAYGAVDRFLGENKYYIDLEDRALSLTTANQRWLAIRLDFLGSLLVFAVAIMSVVGVNGVSPAEIGLVLSTLTGVVQIMGFMTRQSAEVENYMNSVERLLQYTSSGDIPQEKPYVVPSHTPPKTWPATGAIELQDLVMSYRAGLPPVLRGVSLSVRGGEKIGVVGRTGAGKSSLMAALFRIVELTSGSIRIDGLDIGEMGLSSVRSKIAIIPQEAGIFSGTIRSNMDPFNEYDDATLHDALRRSHLLGDESKQATSPLGLDSPITAEGANLSVGQRSLLSLARALVKQTKILVLDEATASVDLETDSKIQSTIKTEFADRTLLCIAHRLRTIINYDRVVVMDEGRIVELGTPAELYARAGGIFRGMCEQSGIDADEMERA